MAAEQFFLCTFAVRTGAPDARGPLIWKNYSND